MRLPQYILRQTRLLVATGVIAICGLSAFGQTTSTNAAAAADPEADKAWKEVEKATRPPMPPAEWQGKRPTEEQIEVFRAEQGKLAGAAAEKALDFYTKYPNHPKAVESRKKEYEMLQFAVNLGNTNKESVLDARMAERLKDPSLSEDERFQMRMQSINRQVMAKEDQGQEAMVAEQLKAARQLVKDFPKREEGYQLLLGAAGLGDEATTRAVAKELIDSPASDMVKKAAQGLVKKMDAMGKPVPIKFSAVDNREVDLTQMKNKVVLIDFWATWCGPCVAEVPNVVKTYEKLHDKGFEIVGISFDADKDALVNFVADKKMTWPQYFDGKRWENKFGREYGISSIPSMWLVDKKGNLRDMNARGALEAKVEKLLAE
jgi:thiol-disulfide isomerase/thioredoxin